MNASTCASAPWAASSRASSNGYSRRNVVESLLRQTNLWEVRKQKLGGYSGGMRQRFGVAIALLGNPKLLIVDGLAVLTRSSVDHELADDELRRDALIRH